MAKVFLGCIADDFTGATDLAGLLRRSGFAVNLRLGVPDGPRDDCSAFEVIALKIRSVPVADAVAQARAAQDWLADHGAERFYWKYCSTFDSMPEGNIGPVAEALMAASGGTQTLYCPAFPENGRSVYMGHLFVGDMPLDESPMKDHPLTPMRDSSLPRLLEPQVTKQVDKITRKDVAEGPDAVRAALSRSEAAHIVADAVEDSDLTTLAEATWDMPLLTGGSALAMPLPQVYADHGLIKEAATAAVPPVLDEGTLVLSGSCSAMTRAQVAQYLTRGSGYQLDPIALAEGGLNQALDWLAAQPKGAPLIAYATAEPDAVAAAQAALGTDTASAVVEDALAALAALAVAARDRGIRRIVVAGGETSGAVSLALGLQSLTVGPEICPGVPWCFGTSGDAPIAVALKSGNFGTETFFQDALDAL